MGRSRWRNGVRERNRGSGGGGVRGKEGGGGEEAGMRVEEK